MKKRKPTALDRDIVDFIRALPIGQHLIDVNTSLVPIKYEGSMVFEEFDVRISKFKRITIIPAVKK